MAPIDQPHTPENREKARSRLRTLTRGAVFAAAGATAVIGVVVSRDHPGSGATGKAASTSSGSGSTTGTSKTDGGSSSSVGSSSSISSGNTGTSSITPSTSQSTPTVTSGGSSR